MYLIYTKERVKCIGARYQSLRKSLNVYMQTRSDAEAKLVTLKRVQLNIVSSNGRILTQRQNYSR